jgi:hypothetical protein
MRLNRAAAAAIAAVAIVSGCGVTHQGAVSVTHPAQHVISAQLTVVQRPASIDPSLAWLESASGQARLAFNDDVDTLTGPGCGTTPQDYTACYQALHASNITVY